MAKWSKTVGLYSKLYVIGKEISLHPYLPFNCNSLQIVVRKTTAIKINLIIQLTNTVSINGYFSKYNFWMPFM